MMPDGFFEKMKGLFGGGEVPIEERDEEFLEAEGLEKKRKEVLLSPEIKEQLRELGIDPDTASEEDIVTAREIYFEKKRRELESLAEREAKSAREEALLRKKAEETEKIIEEPLRKERLEEEFRRTAYQYGKTPKEVEGFLATMPTQGEMDAYLTKAFEDYTKQREEEGEKLERIKWTRKAAQAATIGAGVHTGFYAAEKLGKAGVATARGARRAIVPKVAERKGISEFYYGRPDVQRLYGGAPKEEKKIPAGEALRPSLEPLRRGLPTTGIRETTMPRVVPGMDLSKLREAGSTFGSSPLAQLIRGPSRRPTQPTLERPTEEYRVPTLLTREPIQKPSPQLEQYILRRGEKEVERYPGEVYFWIGPRQRWEKAFEAWITEGPQPGMYRFAGIGERTGTPRSKVIGKDIGQAFEVAIKGPRPGEVPG